MADETPKESLKETPPEKKPNGKSSKEGDLPIDLPIEPEILEKLPPEARKRFVESLSMISMAGPIHPPFMKKINEEHITKLIEYSENESKRSYEDVQAARKYGLAYLILAFVLFGFIVVYLADRNPGLLKDILVVLGIFAGGFGSGYGLKTFQDR